MVTTATLCTVTMVTMAKLCTVTMVIAQPKVKSLYQSNNDFKVFKKHRVKDHLLALLLPMVTNIQGVHSQNLLCNHIRTYLEYR